jgi:hypothetical protein
MAILAVFVVIGTEVLRNSSFPKSIDAIETIAIPCEITYHPKNINNEKSAIDLDVKKETSDLCLQIREVTSLNNSIKLSEAISLMAIFVAIVGIMLPLFGFFSIKHQRILLENEFNKKFSELASKLRENIKQSIDNFPHLLIEANNFRREYLIHRLKVAIGVYSIGEIDKINSASISKNISDNLKGETFHSLNSILTAAFQLEYALLNLALESNEGVRKMFAMIGDYIEPEDVLNNKKYIQKLKQVLAQYYDAGVFSGDEKQQALNDFLLEKLKTNPAQWYKEYKKIQINP